VTIIKHQKPIGGEQTMSENKNDAYDIVFDVVCKIEFLTDIALAMGFSMEMGHVSFSQTTMEGLHRILRDAGNELQRVMGLLEDVPACGRTINKLQNG
jgi:hypothetical protein